MGTRIILNRQTCDYEQTESMALESQGVRKTLMHPDALKILCNTANILKLHILIKYGILKRIYIINKKFAVKSHSYFARANHETKERKKKRTCNKIRIGSIICFFNHERNIHIETNFVGHQQFPFFMSKNLIINRIC